MQLELLNTCRNSCSNCTRFAGHRKPYVMDFEFFKRAVDSMVDFPKMVGFQGGDPLLHPDFERMCEYAASKIPPDRLGLWTTFPKGKEHYREVICRTFKHVFLNDHTRADIYHHPVLVGIEEQVKDPNVMWAMIDKCWAQESWSASIYPSGAWFCEIAGSMSMLFAEECKEKDWAGWEVEPGWWWRIPADFAEQMQMFCTRCGFPAKLRRRSSQRGDRRYLREEPGAAQGHIAEGRAREVRALRLPEQGRADGRRAAQVNTRTPTTGTPSPSTTGCS